MDLTARWDGEGVLPPKANQVAERLLALMILDLRCAVETRAAAGDDAATQMWVQSHSLIEEVQRHLHRIERELLFDTEVGSWDADTRRDVHWLIEAQAILRWALFGMEDLPPPDALVQASVLDGSPLLSPRSFVDGARLRPAAALQTCEDLWSFWLWRANAGPFRGRRLLPPHVRENVELAVSQELVPLDTLIEDDVSAFGLPVFRLSEDQQELLASTVTERCRAARWLCGHAEGFYEISLEISPL